jgi:hypothetical protein
VFLQIKEVQVMKKSKVLRDILCYKENSKKEGIQVQNCGKLPGSSPKARCSSRTRDSYVESMDSSGKFACATVDFASARFVRGKAVKPLKVRVSEQGTRC